MTAVCHPLLERFLAAANGDFPDVDGRVLVQAALGRGLEAVIGFTGHGVVATSLPEAAVLERCGDGFGGCFAPAFLCWLAGPQGTLGSIDLTLVGRGRGKGGETRSLRRVSPDVEKVPNAGKPIWPGSPRPHPRSGGGANPARI